MRIWGVDSPSFKREQEGFIRYFHFKPERDLSTCYITMEQSYNIMFCVTFGKGASETNSEHSEHVQILTTAGDQYLSVAQVYRWYFLRQVDRESWEAEGKHNRRIVSKCQELMNYVPN